MLIRPNPITGAVIIKTGEGRKVPLKEGLISCMENLINQGKYFGFRKDRFRCGTLKSERTEKIADYQEDQGDGDKHEQKLFTG
jgi:hypothetical protein